MRLISALTTVLFSLSVFAHDMQMTQPLVDMVGSQPIVLAPNWKVGDEADYSINMGFIKGSMHSFIREEVYEGLWFQQDMDLGIAGKQKVEILIDKNSGEILQLLVNGEKKEIPDGGNQEVIEMEEAQVTVPAGTFDCVYVKIRDTKENKDSEAWINPSEIPVMGLLKQVAPGPFGEVVVELTGYDKK